MQAGVDFTIRQLLPSDRLKSFSAGDSSAQPLKTFSFGFTLLETEQEQDAPAMFLDILQLPEAN